MARRGNPLFYFRITPKSMEAMKEAGRLYGAPNTSAFLREMVEAHCCGDAERAEAFSKRLFTKLGERLQLELGIKVAHLGEGLKPMKTAKKRKGGRRAKSA